MSAENHRAASLPAVHAWSQPTGAGKAQSIDCDTIIFDLEDAVAGSAKLKREPGRGRTWRLSIRVSRTRRAL